MGICDCYNEKEISNQKIVKFKDNKLAPVNSDRNFKVYIFVGGVQDFFLKNYNFNEPAFKLVKKEENKMLINFHDSKKMIFNLK